MSSDRWTKNTERLALSDELRASRSQHDLGSCGVVGVEADKLLRIASLAEQFNSDQITDDARSAAERIADGRFYVACVGQFKRGKSTLLNALIGDAVVPTGFIPVTAVPTVIRFGEAIHARVRMRDASWRDIAMTDLKEYVTEELNPENKKAVDGAEVFVPSPLLSSGMCFVDRSEEHTSE